MVYRYRGQYQTVSTLKLSKAAGVIIGRAKFYVDFAVGGRVS
jgi:hypothetical protein